LGETRWEINLKKEIPENSFIIVGLPDVGLVGPISTSHLVRVFELEEIGYVDSPALPPVILFHKGKPHFPVRIYGGYKGNDYIVVLHADVAVPPAHIHELASIIVEKALDVKAREIILLGGIAVPNRMKIEKPKTYVASISREVMEAARARGVEPLSDGFVGGIYAQILKEGFKRGVKTYALLSECFFNYPDPGAAAATLEVLGRFIGHEVDVTKLLEQEEEIRIKLRELMKRTMEAMKGSGKEYEFTVPALYA